MSNPSPLLSRTALFPALLLVLGLATGCSVTAQPPVTSQVERSGLDVVIVPEGQKAAFFKDGGSLERFCAAPESDVADVYGGGLSLGASEGDLGESVGYSQSESAVALGGRSPVTLLTRELLYRACELSLNINADGQTTQDIYDRFLEAVIKISAQQVASGTGTATVSADGSVADTSSSDETSTDSEDSSDESSSVSESSSDDGET